MLQELFSEEEVGLICMIPISFRLLPDRLVWHYNSRGAYTISSGYLVAREVVQSPSAGASTSEGSNAFSPLWKSI